MKVEELTHKIIGMAMKIHSTMGCGFVEPIYHNSLIVELRKAAIPFESKKKLDVYYEDVLVGTLEADLVILVDDRLIIELKAVENLVKAHEAQLVNYLTATRIDDGLLLKFGSTRLQQKRKFRLYKPKIV